MEERFYYCNMCGNLAFMAIASGVATYCCGEQMELLEPNVSDGSEEKHVPVVECIDNNTIKVCVGSTLHPMTDEHYIRFLCVTTSKCVIIRYLNIGEDPCATIHFDGTLQNVYAYCNKHGLWKKEM